jgi:AraC-like DNA-binding protein
MLRFYKLISGKVIDFVTAAAREPFLLYTAFASRRTERKMKYCTSGKVFWKYYEMPLSIDEHASSADSVNGEYYYRITFLAQGKSTLILPDGKIIAIAPLVFCLNEKEYLRFMDDENIVHHSICFKPSVINSIFTEENILGNNKADFNTTTEQDFAMLEPFREREKGGLAPIRLGSASALRLRDLYRDLHEELAEQNSKELWPCRSRSIFLEILFLLSRSRGPLVQQEEVPVIEEGPSIDLDALIAYLNANYMKEISVDKLARLFGTNRTTLSNSFKGYTGDSIIAHLIKIRIDIASMMLRNTRLPISEIMRRAGFNDPTHFTRMFKKMVNHAPSEYRAKYCWNEGKEETLQEAAEIAQ